VAGYYDKYVAYAFKAVTEIRMSRQVVRKLDSGEIANILTVCDHRFEQVELDNATEPNVTTRARKLQRQRGTPGARADNGNRL